MNVSATDRKRDGKLHWSLVSFFIILFACHWKAVVGDRFGTSPSHEQSKFEPATSANLQKKVEIRRNTTYKQKISSIEGISSSQGEICPSDR